MKNLLSVLSKKSTRGNSPSLVADADMLQTYRFNGEFQRRMECWIPVVRAGGRDHEDSLVGNL